jgi:RimJ/RimL family protein N-acetyltransferase
MCRPAFELRRWMEEDRDDFADLHADPHVMADLGGPFERAASDDKFDRYRDAWTTNGISRWVVSDTSGRFLGYAGVMRRDDPDHPLGSHYEIGWRFRRDAWGNGYATESAARALSHAWQVLDAAEITAYTAADNVRSRAVMTRLGLRRDETRDFTARYPKGDWTGLVWVVERPSLASPC